MELCATISRHILAVTPLQSTGGPSTTRYQDPTIVAVAVPPTAVMRSLLGLLNLANALAHCRPF